MNSQELIEVAPELNQRQFDKLMACHFVDVVEFFEDHPKLIGSRTFDTELVMGWLGY